MKLISNILLSAVAVAAIACGSGNAKQAEAKVDAPQPAVIDAPEFSADSAYAFVAQQVAFGPRVPGSAASRQTADWILGKLREFGASNIEEQHTQLKAYDGTPLDACNISAQFNLDTERRVLLLAHWDTRPWADNEADSAKRRLPIDGANDGASGVGVILEIARHLSERQPGVGIDVLFVDAEDYGRHADEPDQAGDNETWALGTQYWVKNPTVALGKVQFAILLDMVGAKDAKFAREYFSQNYSRAVVDYVWDVARASGFGSRFVDDPGTPVVDDHYYLIQAGIPAIDIIECAHPSTGSFNPTWHTQADNIDGIDPETLRAVGQTVTNVIYNL